LEAPLKLFVAHLKSLIRKENPLTAPSHSNCIQPLLKSASLLILALVFLPIQPLLHAQGAGYWHTNGSQIVDANGDIVRIAGINWYGFETTDEVAHGLASQDYHEILNTIKAEGYNTIRLPFSNQMAESPIIPSDIATSNATGAINTDLAGLNSLQIMDKIITAAGADGLKVILDNHRSEAGNSNEWNGLWYTSAYPESNWIADWQTLVTRYSSFKDGNGNPIVIGVDVRNEPYTMVGGSPSGSCWTGDTTTGGCPTTNTTNNWPAAATRAATAILAINPNLLIFVEGVDCYSGSCDWQGGNLSGAGQYPVTLPVANRLVYSAHDYGPDLYGQPWFNGSTTSASLQAVWTKNWAYLSLDGTAPVWVGEFGTTNVSTDIENSAAGSQGQWFSSLVGFLENQPGINWTYWALNGEDSFALLDSDYDAAPASALKQQELASIQFPLTGLSANSPACAAAPVTPASLAAKSASVSSITLTWGAVAAPANCSVSYTVYRATTKGFTPSSANQVAASLTAASYADSGLAASTPYYYAVEAVDAHGSSAASAQATATTAAIPVCGASPARPGGFAASSTSDSSINLAWTAVAAPANCSVSYTVYRSTTKGFTPSSASQVAASLTAASYADNGLAASTPYYYAVEAVDAHGSSAPSAQATATTKAIPVCGASPAKPSGLAASSTSDSSINLSWTAVAAPANCSVSYSVYRATSKGFTPAASNQVASGLTSAAYASTGLTASSTYYYAVEAVDAHGSSAASAQASATTPAAPKQTSACHVVYTVTGSWGTGFQAGIVIENTGTTSWSSWTLAWAFPNNQSITDFWVGAETQSGETVTVSNESYNGTVAAGGSVQGLGFIASYSGTNSVPASFSVNGVACK
jgi:endoglucanase